MGSRDKVRELAAEGLSDKKIAERTGLSRPAVRSYRAAAGILRCPAKSPRTRAETVAMVAELFGAGLKRAEVAEALGISPGTVREYKRFAGLTRRRPTMSEDGGRETAIELARQGVAVSEIAARLGRSPCTVWNVLREAGVRMASVAEVNREKVAELAAKGLTDTEISEATGLCPATVLKHRHAAGIRYRDRSGGRIMVALDLLRNGVPTAEVAARLGLKKSTVIQYRYLYRDRLGGAGECDPFAPTPARPKKSPRARVEEVAGLVREGLDDPEVAARTGLSLSSVMAYRRRAGLVRNGGRGSRREPD